MSIFNPAIFKTRNDVMDIFVFGTFIPEGWKVNKWGQYEVMLAAGDEIPGCASFRLNPGGESVNVAIYHLSPADVRVGLCLDPRYIDISNDPSVLVETIKEIKLDLMD